MKHQKYTCSFRKNIPAIAFGKLAIFLLILVSFAGCKSLRNLGLTTSGSTNAEMVLLDLQTNQPWPEWYSARFSGRAEWEGKSQSLAGTIRMQKDSAIYVSIAPILGIEVARILITPDSVRIINRLESIYYAGGIQALGQRYKADVDFEMLQAMFLGNDFPNFATSMFELAEDPNFIKLTADRRVRTSGVGDAVSQTITISPSTMRIRTNIVEQPGSGRAIRADYLNHESIDGKLIPNDLKFSFGDSNGISSLELTLSRFILNEAQSLQFSVPASYTKVRLTD